MSVTVSVNGTTYTIPSTGETNWGAQVTAWIQAVSNSTLQKSGGSFALTAELDLGASYGLKSLYLKSRTANVADSGQVRLAKTDSIQWRNAANTGNLRLEVNSSNQLVFDNGVISSPVQTEISISDTATIDLTLSGATLSADIKAGSIDNSMLSPTAAIAYSKISLTGAIVNGDISASAGIAYSKLALTGAIVNADIATGAAIAYSKLALSGSIVNADISPSATIAYSKLSLSGSIVNGDISASAAIAYSKLALTSSIVNADISASAAIAYSKLSLSGSIVNTDISASAAISYSKLNLSGSIVNSDIGASAAIAYSKLNLASSIVNADIASGAAIAYSKLSLSGSIVNADISSSANIARSKIAAGTANGVVVNDASGAFSSVAPSTSGNVLTSNGTAWVSSAPAAAPSSHSARYSTTAGQSISAGATDIINFGTQDYDTSSLVTTGASWKYTASQAGTYSVVAFLTTGAATFAAGNKVIASLYKNGTIHTRIGIKRFETAVSGTAGIADLSCVGQVKLSVGDFIDIRVNPDVALAMNTAAGTNWIAINREGD